MRSVKYLEALRAKNSSLENNFQQLNDNSLINIHNITDQCISPSKMQAIVETETNPSTIKRKENEISEITPRKSQWHNKDMNKEHPLIDNSSKNQKQNQLIYEKENTSKQSSDNIELENLKLKLIIKEMEVKESLLKNELAKLKDEIKKIDKEMKSKDVLII